MMTKIKMIARKDFPFGGKSLHAGDAFQADDAVQATTLETIGYATRDLVQEETKGRYRRRDLRAEH